MKYVVFLDILGFKNKLRTLKYKIVKDFIANFSATIYKIFKKKNLSNKVNGYIVSDSIILYSSDIREESLVALIELIVEICRSEFTQNGILIRGAIAKGEFDRIPAIELPRLQKQLIVGEAYIDAYLLESSVKVIGINLSKEVYKDILNTSIVIDIIEEKNNQSTYYLLKYINVDFLLLDKNLQHFISLAREAKWLPHYYNTIYFATKKEKNDKKIEQVFIKIEDIISKNWHDLDLFIKNAFAEGVIDSFKLRFLRHIRQKLR